MCWTWGEEMTSWLSFTETESVETGTPLKYQVMSGTGAPSLSHTNVMGLNPTNDIVNSGPELIIFGGTAGIVIREL